MECQLPLGSSAFGLFGTGVFEYFKYSASPPNETTYGVDMYCSIDAQFLVFFICGEAASTLGCRSPRQDQEKRKEIQLQSHSNIIFKPMHTCPSQRRHHVEPVCFFSTLLPFLTSLKAVGMSKDWSHFVKHSREQKAIHYWWVPDSTFIAPRQHKKRRMCTILKKGPLWKSLLDFGSLQMIIT